jgi:hypothetical protein
MDMWSAEERQHVYQMLRFRVYAAPYETTEVEMTIDYMADFEKAPRCVKNGGHIDICPHGRPIVTRLSLADLLREFARI